MFSATVHQIVRALGKDTLLPVNSVDVSDNIDLLSLVVKETKRRYLFWTKEMCLSTPFALQDILADQTTPLNVKKDDKVICEFNRKTDISLKGKFGVELSKELFDIDLEGARSVSLDSPLGELKKQEVDIPSLMNEIAARKVNLKHELLKSLITEGKTLCVVTGVVKLTKDVVLSSQVQMDESGKLGGSLLCGTGRSVSASASEEMDEKKTKTMKLPAGTALVYTVYDLVISTKDGSFKLQIERETPGGFVRDSVAPVDSVDGVADAFAAIETTGDPAAIFSALLKLEPRRRELMGNIVRGIMEVPKTIQPLSKLLSEAEMFMAENIEKTTTLENLNQKVGNMDDDLQQFLIMAGFEFKNGSMIYPQTESELFQVCQILMTLLEEFEDDELAALSCCVEDEEGAQDLLLILKKTQNLRAEEVVLLENEAAALTTDCAKQFIDAVDLKINDKTLIIPKDNRFTVSAAYFILFAIFGK